MSNEWLKIHGNELCLYENESRYGIYSVARFAHRLGFRERNERCAEVKFYCNGKE